MADGYDLRPLTDIPTPFVLVHGPTVRRNIGRVASYAKAHGLAVRPHSKTHKSLFVGRTQLDAGAIGLTIAKVGEAEVFAAICDDLLLAYPVVDPAKAARLAAVAEGRTVRAAVDSELGVRTLAEAARARGVTLGLLVDLDIGNGRTGCPSAAEAHRLARLMAETPGVRFDGVFYYPGHVGGPAERQAAMMAQVSDRVAGLLDLLRSDGLEAGIVSGGSTPTLFHSHLDPHLTEIRPGTNIYNDVNTIAGDYCDLDDCAARVTSAVVSTAAAGQVVIDAGSKTLTSDRCGPDPDRGYGLVVEYPEAHVRALNEEHGMVDVSRCATAPRLGERVTVVPNHVCPCVNLHDVFWWTEDGETARPMPVDARGKVA
jgi:D-serine deaminase-like pyridoxal phosphate-dependent protein